MKRLLAGLLLAVAIPASAATYYVSPTGGYGRTPTRDGSNWTDAKALTLAWANDSASAGDVIRMKLGNHAADIRPRKTGTPANYITFIGNLDTLANVVVRNITVDSTDGAKQCISIKGVYATGDVSFKSLNATTPGQVAGYDSLQYSRADGSLLIVGRSNVTVKNCTIGDGSARDYFHFGNGFGTGGWARTQHMDSMYVSDCTFNLASDTKNHCENVLTSHGVSTSTIERCRFFLAGSAGSGDFSLQTHYDSNGLKVKNCYFEGTYNGLTAYEPMYLLNMRDNQVNNLWESDTLVEASSSPLKLKVYFQSDGNLLDVSVGGSTVTYDYGDSNNTFVGNTVKVRGPIVVDSPIAKYKFHRNVLATAEDVKLGNTNLRELTFRHNTVFSSGAKVINKGTKAWNSTVTQNIFACAQAVGCDGLVGFYNITTAVQSGIPGNLGVCDSNLYYCVASPDSFKVIDLSPLSGGCAKRHYSKDVWTTTYGYDGKSHWANPGFKSMDPLAFDPAPNPASIVFSSNLWADQFAGAISVPADVTAPAVAITEPSGAHPWTYGETMHIAWTSTDAVGVTAQVLEFGYGASPSSWTTIASVSSTATSYDWAVPTFTSSLATLRIRALDAAANEGSASVSFRCSITDPDPTTSRDTP